MVKGHSHFGFDNCFSKASCYIHVHLYLFSTNKSSWICMKYLPLDVKQPTINQSTNKKVPINGKIKSWGILSKVKKVGSWGKKKRRSGNVLSQESDVQCLSFDFMWFISVFCFSFLYRLNRCFSRLNGFTLVIFWALLSLLIGVSKSSVLKTVLWPIMVYFYKLLLGWRVVSLALIPHLPISIFKCEYI